jgi:hypothetical protein
MSAPSAAGKIKSLRSRKIHTHIFSLSLSLVEERGNWQLTRAEQRGRCLGEIVVSGASGFGLVGVNSV